MKYILLTKDNCPDCELVKKFLSTKTGQAKYGFIEVVHLEENPDLAESLIAEHQIMKMPAVISGGRVLRSVNAFELAKFIKEAAVKEVGAMK